MVGNYTLFGANGKKIVELAARHKVPAMYVDRGYSENGGLLSYVSDSEQGRNAGLYTGRILKGKNLLTCQCSSRQG